MEYVVIKEIPSARDLMGFDYFDDIPVGSILYTRTPTSGCIMYNGMNVCDVNSKMEKEYLKCRK